MKGLVLTLRSRRGSTDHSGRKSTLSETATGGGRDEEDAASRVKETEVVLLIVDEEENALLVAIAGRLLEGPAADRAASRLLPLIERQRLRETMVEVLTTPLQ
jgi:hypothetical protein